MAMRHWLDPLARRLLVATGQLPAQPTAQAAREQAVPAQAVRESEERETIERELLALRLRQNPSLRLRDAEEVRHAAALGWRLDVNRATPADWLRLPGSTPAQVDLLQRLRAGGVQLSGPEDLQRLLELDEAQIHCWQPLLEFRWYGEGVAPAAEAPLDLNRADAAQLEALLPALPAGPRQRLLRERLRGPFHDLADLQHRLQLPPAVVEALIGRVCFGSGPLGPTLPPRRPPRGRS